MNEQVKFSHQFHKLFVKIWRLSPSIFFISLFDLVGKVWLAKDYGLF